MNEPFIIFTILLAYFGFTFINFILYVTLSYFTNPKLIVKFSRNRNVRMEIIGLYFLLFLYEEKYGPVTLKKVMPILLSLSLLLLFLI